MKNKIHKKSNYGYNSFREQLFKIIKIFVIVLVVFGLFYLLTLYLLNKPNTNISSEKSEEAVTISYKTILAGSSFDMGDDYLVLYYDNSDDDLKSTYTNLISSYESTDNHLSIYVVDTNSAFNKKYISNSSNINPSSIQDLKVKNNTLIHFKDGKVTQYIENQNNIENYLQ